jgi:hypothetical protein
MTDNQQLGALIKACDFAAKKHRNQKRKDGLGKFEKIISMGF